MQPPNQIVVHGLATTRAQVAKMSGFEIVGVVLGTLPLVLGAVSQYGKGVSTPDPGPLFFLGSEDGCSRTNAKTQEVLWSCSNGTRP